MASDINKKGLIGTEGFPEYRGKKKQLTKTGLPWFRGL
jgi:hypothetical protein